MLKWLIEIIQIHAELVDEEWFNDLVIKKYAFGKPTLILLGLTLDLFLITLDFWPLYRQLLLKHFGHFMVLKLESAHYVFATEDQVHNAGHQLPLTEFLRAEVNGNCIGELHDSLILF